MARKRGGMIIEERGFTCTASEVSSISLVLALLTLSPEEFDKRFEEVFNWKGKPKCQK